jgi:hypothetical protein
MTETQLNGSGSGNATTVAYFVTDHGYGHATRAAAVMGAMSREAPGIRFEIFTTAPRWLFEGRQPLQYRYHRLKTDVGLVQSSPFEVDLQATVRQLGTTLPFDPGQVTETAALLKDIDTRIVICDIAPIGIDIAEKAGLPSVLVENFTWDWIYAGYRSRHGGLRRFSEILSDTYARAQLRIQVHPFCQPVPGALKTNPVCRPISPYAARVRPDLGISPSENMVLLSMGGLAGRQNFRWPLPDIPGTVFVIPGGDATLKKMDNVILLPGQPEYSHPDLASAADAVIGKVGYSTVAEVFQAGVAFGYLIRKDFRESAVLADFIDRNIPSIRLDPDAFFSGGWQEDLSKLLSMPRRKRNRPNGALQAARHIIGQMNGGRLV